MQIFGKILAISTTQNQKNFRANNGFTDSHGQGKLIQHQRAIDGAIWLDAYSRMNNSE